MATAGRILIMPKGAYKSSETYSNLDMVSHNGRCWVAKKVVTGIEPSEENNDYWHDLLGTDLTPEAIGALDKGDIVDNLISASTELALSANQGKVLKRLIDANANAITQLYSDLTQRTLLAEFTESSVKTCATPDISSFRYILGIGYKSQQIMTSEFIPASLFTDTGLMLTASGSSGMLYYCKLIRNNNNSVSCDQLSNFDYIALYGCM